MVAALYSSKKGRTKLFNFEGTSFGWEVIEKREVDHAKAGHYCREPGLRENYIYRDVWTRLNVKPAKIMKVRTIYTYYMYVCLQLVREQQCLKLLLKSAWT